MLFAQTVDATHLAVWLTLMNTNMKMVTDALLVAPVSYNGVMFYHIQPLTNVKDEGHRLDEHLVKPLFHH